MTFNQEQFLEKVQQRIGVPDEDLKREVCLVLQVLGECLHRRDAQLLAEELPGELATTVLGAEHEGSLDLPRFYTRTGALMLRRPGEAVELTRVVLETVADALSADRLTCLRRALDESVAELLRPPDAPPERPPHVPGTGRTLADGRGGSSRPLYLAGTDETGILAQAGSVVASANPHEDTKLSSSHGVAQEREDRTIASTRR